MSLPLITDRTSTDASRRAALRAKIKDRTATSAEWSEWLSPLKGAYNATDLNRVESAVAYLTEQFNALPDTLAGYLSSLCVAPDSIFAVPYAYPISLTVKTDWAIGDNPTAEAMGRYIANIHELRETIALPPDTPMPPGSMEKLTVTGANNIERVLEIIDAATLELEGAKKTYAENAAAAFVYAGEIYSGEV